MSGKLDAHQVLISVVGQPHAVLFEQVERVPLVVCALGGGLRLAIGVESLVCHLVHVEVVGGVEALAFHPLATVARECDLATGNPVQVLDDLGTDQVSLA